MTKNFIVEAESQGTRLDAYLAKNITAVSRVKIKKAILEGKLFLDGKQIYNPSLKLKAGMKVVLDIEPDTGELKAQDLDLEIIYEDDDFLAINKPAGLVVHPGANLSEGTLANALVAKYPEISQVGHQFRPGIIHRLDKDTSGVLLIAKNNKALEYGQQIFKIRSIKKQYQALVCGRLETLHGFIEKPLLLDPRRRKVIVSEKGKPAKTEFKVKDYYQDPNTLDVYTLLDVILHTGRTHQIRVHFADLGHPLAGDLVYSPKNSKPESLHRHFLHAKRLQFKLPGGTYLDLEAPLPQDLQNVLNNLAKL